MGNLRLRTATDRTDRRLDAARAVSGARRRSPVPERGYLRNATHPLSSPTRLEQMTGSASWIGAGSQSPPLSRTLGVRGRRSARVTAMIPRCRSRRDSRGMNWSSTRPAVCARLPRMSSGPLVNRRRLRAQSAELGAGLSFSSKNSSTRSTPSCWRCSVSVACLRPGNSTAMKLSPSSRRSVSKRVPTAGSCS